MIFKNLVFFSHFFIYKQKVGQKIFLPILQIGYQIILIDLTLNKACVEKEKQL